MSIDQIEDLELEKEVKVVSKTEWEDEQNPFETQPNSTYIIFEDHDIVTIASTDEENNVKEGDFSKSIEKITSMDDDENIDDNHFPTAKAVVEMKGKGSKSMKIGEESSASESDTTAIGNASKALGKGATAVGRNAWATEKSTVAVGQGAAAGKDFSVSIGYNVDSSGLSSTAIGDRSSATKKESTAIGAGAKVQKDNQIMLGTENEEVTLPGTGTLETVSEDEKSLINKEYIESFYQQSILVEKTDWENEYTTNPSTNYVINDDEKIIAIASTDAQNNIKEVSFGSDSIVTVQDLRKNNIINLVEGNTWDWKEIESHVIYDPPGLFSKLEAGKTYTAFIEVDNTEGSKELCYFYVLLGRSGSTPDLVVGLGLREEFGQFYLTGTFSINEAITSFKGVRLGAKTSTQATWSHGLKYRKLSIYEGNAKGSWLPELNQFASERNIGDIIENAPQSQIDKIINRFGL